jgi:hypothetical protein
MNADAMVLALVALADLALIVELRRRRHRRIQQARMMSCLRIALHWANRGAYSPICRVRSEA